jgi:hypothetical protein
MADHLDDSARLHENRLFERPSAATIDDLNNKIAFQHLTFHVSAEEFIAAQIQLAELGVQIDGPEDTGRGLFDFRERS